MFDVVPEQFHQFIASRVSLSPLTLPALSDFSFHGFDPFQSPNPSPLHPPLLLPPHQQHNFLHQPSILLHHKDVQGEEEKDKSLITMSMNFDIDVRSDRAMPGAADDHSPWSNDEVVALLKIGSSMENCFQEVTWERVSRNLAELGLKRSAEKCKEKFEEQTGSFNNNININVSYSKANNYRLLVHELEELHDHQSNPARPLPPPEQQQIHDVPHSNNNDNGKTEKQIGEEEKVEEQLVGRGGEEGEKLWQNNTEEVDSRAVESTSLAGGCERLVEEDRVRKKRKRREKFEVFKRFCENIVERFMVKQEEMHNKFLEDMMRRDREIVEKEETWKKMETERTNKELDIRAHEQTIAQDRQASIIEFLKRLISPSCEGQNDDDHHLTNRVDTENASEIPSATTVPTDDDQSNPSPPPPPVTGSPNPNCLSTPQNLRISNTEGSDTGKRWPREEVLALINLRCTIQAKKEDRDQHPPGAVKAPLWERISQGMSGLGYKRSAKRCKEKWENINKYFKKTKDSNVNRKRSLDTRTCPYFHQLSTLYNQGKFTAVTPPEHRPSLLEYPPKFVEDPIIN